MVYFRCLIAVFFVHVFDIPLDAAALSFVLRNDGEACQEFLILPTDKKEGEGKGEGKKKKIENCWDSLRSKKAETGWKGKKDCKI